MSMTLGEALVQQGVIDAAGLEKAQSHQAESGASLGKALIELGLCTQDDLYRGVAAQLGMAFADVSAGAVDTSAASLLSRKTAKDLGALPVAYGPGNTLVVAISDPARQDEVRQRVTAETGVEVTVALAPPGPLADAIEALAAPEPPVGHAPAPPSGSARLGEVHLAPDERRLSQPPPREVEDAEAASLPQVDSETDSEIDLDELLVILVESGGSDLHLTVGIPPAIRVNGEIRHLEEFPVCRGDELRKMLYAIMTQKHREEFENNLELDMSYSVPGKARFRVNIFQQRDQIGSVMRVIPFDILPLADLGMPAQLQNFAYLPRGFVLVTGPTGSGKSTTLASIIDLVNENRAAHIMTVEDPIEFLHHHKRSVVNQREVGTDTHSFTQALKHVLRQDPDVILVGEMRDLETISIALTAAETGHLVFGTLHTQDAPQSIDRIIDVFPPHQQEQIRVMLAGALQGVVCQTLVKTADGKGRAAATEVMVTTSGVKNLIREGKTHQIYSAIQAGAQHGMHSMDSSLAGLVKSGKVTYEAALEKCNNVAEFNRLAGRG